MEQKNMDVLQKIQTIIKTNYPQIKQKITSDTILGDIDYLDSLELATIAVELENECDIRFPDEDLENIKTKSVGEIVQEIKALSAQKEQDANGKK